MASLRFNAAIEIVHENEICLKLFGQCDCCQFSYAQWGSCGIDIGVPNVQPSWWRSDPSSYCDWCAEMLKFVNNSDWHDNLSVEAWKEFNLSNL